MSHLPLKEGRRVSFKGTKVNQLYNIVKDEWNPMVFVNGKLYAVEPENMRHDLQDTYVLGVDEDGEEYDIDVSDIEFIEL